MFLYLVTLSFYIIFAYGKWLQPYEPYGSYPAYYGHNESYEELYNNTEYDYDNYTSRIRYLKAIEVNVNVTIDIELSIPLPDDAGSIDLSIPISIIIQNKTILKVPYPYPPVKVPLFYPVIKLPKLPSFLPHKPVSKPSGGAYQSNDYYNDYSDPNEQALYEYYGHPKHQLAKRSLAAQSALHRREIFDCIAQSLDKHGYTGKSCILKAICQLAQQELLIESVVHEMLEHLLTVSRGVDEDHLLAEYLEAEESGEKQEDCMRKYSCAFSLFEKL